MKSYESKVCDFYTEFNEDSRLSRDQAHMVEFHTTLRFIRENLIENDPNRILEIGCGTGAYSLVLAGDGHSITASDISDNNLKLLKNRIKEGMDIEVAKVNATDLSDFEDESYDLTTMLGPLYHLKDDKDIKEAIKEAKRVTRKGGSILIAFLSKDYIVMRNCEEIFNEEVDDIEGLIDGYDAPDGIFNYMTIDDIEALIKENGFSEYKLVSTDGITQFLENEINSLSEVEYNAFLEYHYRNCERKELMGYSAHLLCVVKNA